MKGEEIRSDEEVSDEEVRRDEVEVGSVVATVVTAAENESGMDARVVTAGVGSGGVGRIVVTGGEMGTIDPEDDVEEGGVKGEGKKLDCDVGGTAPQLSGVVAERSNGMEAAGL